ncbi:hypothetical protein FOZ61_009689 [Perkinsus olseni]|uniref:Uncharacterized protein n=1 Tax=Perkinsus olseni TaxID=32597 RepID=A0A7J6KZT1_PEROL|nr:hypothetical protein FOZ61_009689 [Perkinsus olseni]KAF4654369.1 hypothetical protein FOL46_008749 [Perkinsus olseni]
MSSITFYLPGMSRPLFARRHQLQSDGAGCLRYSAGAPSDTALAHSSIEDVKKRLGDGFSQELDWSDMKVCPDTATTASLILNGRSHVLRRVTKFFLSKKRNGGRDSSNRTRHHELARAITSSATVARSPANNPTHERLETSVARQPPFSIIRRVHLPAVVRQSTVHGARLPKTATYENTEPITGLRKIRLTIQDQSLYSLEFHTHGARRPLTIGPYKMIPSLLTGSLKYDLSDGSLCQRVSADLNRLTKLWAGDWAKNILPTAIAIYPLDDAHVELIIGTERYKMASTSIPVFNEDPERSSYLATALAADPEKRGLASLSRERKRPKIEEVRGATSSLSPASTSNVVVVQQFDEETKQEAVDGAASEPPERQRLGSPVETQTKLNAAELPPIGVYENESPILNFTKVHNDHLSANRMPRVRSERKLGARSSGRILYRTAKRLSRKGFGKIYATEVKVCGSPSGQVELSIANIRYPMQPAGSLKTQGLQGAAGTPGKAALRRFLRAKGHQPSPKGVEISGQGLVVVDLFEDLWAQLARSPTEPSSGSLRPDALLDYLDPMHDGPI